MSDNKSSSGKPKGYKQWSHENQKTLEQLIKLKSIREHDNFTTKFNEPEISKRFPQVSPANFKAHARSTFAAQGSTSFLLDDRMVY